MTKAVYVPQPAGAPELIGMALGQPAGGARLNAVATGVPVIDELTEAPGIAKVLKFAMSEITALVGKVLVRRGNSDERIPRDVDRNVVLDGFLTP